MRSAKSDGNGRHLGMAVCIASAMLCAEPCLAGSVPYAKLVTSQIMFEQIPASARDKVIVRAAVTHADATDHSPIHLWVEDAGKRTDLPVGKDGVIDLELRQDWVDRGVTVTSDQPDKSLSVGVDIGIRQPAGQPITDAYLRDAVRQTQAVIAAGARQMAGFLALFVTPKVRGVKIKLARCCAETAILQLQGRSQRFAQDGKGEIGLTLAVLDAWDGGELALPAAVVSIDPWIDG